ncbi:MAG: hypothetical protein ACYC91_04135 [Solirubrobacteraceae bacterium]
MALAGIVTIVLVVVAIVVVALFLIRISMVLRGVSSSLSAVIGAVGSIPEKTEPITPMLTSINRDLGIAQGVLEGLLARKLGPPQEPSPILHQRPFEPGAELESEPEFEDEPEFEEEQQLKSEAPGPEFRPESAPERPHFSSGRIVYRHRPAAPPAPTPARTSTEETLREPAPMSETPPTVIHYRRGGQ